MHLRRKFFMAHPSPRLDPQSKTKRTSQTSHALEADSTGNPCSWIKALRQHQEAGQWGTDINSRSRERTNEIWQTAKIKYKMRVCLCVCSVAQSCLTLCNCMDCSHPGSSVHGIFQARILGGSPSPPPGHLPNPGIKLVSLASPTLAGRLFTTVPPGKSVMLQSRVRYNWVTELNTWETLP